MTLVASTQTVSELYLQFIRGRGRIFWVLGHQVQVSWSMALKKHTQKKTYTHSLYFTHFIAFDE